MAAAAPSPAAGERLAVELRGIRKAFPGVLANDGTELAVRWGEIHALLGENGAGKSTLMNVLLGLYQPDAGEVRVDGRPVRLRSPGEARALGIAMVHQHFVQSERHTALQNVVLGSPRLGLFPRWDRLRDEVREAARRYGLEVELDAPLYELPVGERQKVEILRALWQGARILVLDEPTAVLSRPETRALFEMLRRFRDEGGAVIFISHKLDEVLELAQRVTILRRGRTVGVHELQQVDAALLARLMVGGGLPPHRRPPPREPGPPVLQLEDVGVLGPRGAELRALSLELRAGEILGIAGVAGSGQEALAALAAGLLRPSTGRLLLFGEPVPADPALFARRGVAYVPSDRLRVGTAGSLSVLENLLLKNHRRWARWGWMRWAAARDWASARLRALDVRCPGLDARVASLSGGNIQKVILARELDGEPRLIVAAHPCRGLDVGAAEEVHEALLAARERGAAVLLLSEDLDELLTYSDRIGVLFRGRLMEVLPAEGASRERIGLLMGGHRPGGAA